MFDDKLIPVSQTTTRAIEIQVRPVFLDSQSNPEESRFLWAYDIQIENKGPETVQLINRKWEIINARGQIERVEGTGVIGEQPVLGPGKHFRYQSGVPLATPSGLMHGKYEMENERGERFWIKVPSFSLDSPYETQMAN